MQSHREIPKENTGEIFKIITKNTEELKSKKVLQYDLRNVMTELLGG